MAEAALEDIVKARLWDKHDDSFEESCDSLNNMAVTNRLQGDAERRQAVIRPYTMSKSYVLSCRSACIAMRRLSCRCCDG